MMMMMMILVVGCAVDERHLLVESWFLFSKETKVNTTMMMTMMMTRMIGWLDGGK